jgi:hypothetical protein
MPLNCNLVVPITGSTLMFKAAFLIQTEGIPSWIAELSGDFTG